MSVMTPEQRVAVRNWCGWWRWAYVTTVHGIRYDLDIVGFTNGGVPSGVREICGAHRREAMQARWRI